jgi:S-adenosylmethionine synthetase
MSMGSYWFTSEPVSEGRISDGVFDAIIAEDQKLRVPCETLVTTGLAFVTGEIATSAYFDIPLIVRDTIKGSGYNAIPLWVSTWKLAPWLPASTNSRPQSERRVWS